MCNCTAANPADAAHAWAEQYEARELAVQVRKEAVRSEVRTASALGDVRAREGISAMRPVRAREGSSTGKTTMNAMPPDPDRERRRRWREYHAEHDRLANEWRDRGYQYPPPVYPPLPHDLVGLTCGARTRAGTPCKLAAIYRNGRCKLHGGLSTGPTSAKGKARSAANGWAQKRANPMRTTGKLSSADHVS